MGTWYRPIPKAQVLESTTRLKKLDRRIPKALQCFFSTHKASLFKTRATLSDSAVRCDRAAAKQLMDRQ